MNPTAAYIWQTGQMIPGGGDRLHRPKRSSRTPRPEQVDLAKELAIAIALGNGRIGVVASTITMERYAVLADQAWMISQWQMTIAIDARDWALSQIPASTVSEQQVADFLLAVDPALLAWCLLPVERWRHHE